MKLKRIIAFILCTVMITGIAPLILFDIKVSAAETIAEYARYTASGTPAIEDGIYIITHDGSTNGTQTSNTTMEIMDITTVPQSGRLGEVTNVTIINDKIQTSRAYELNFKRSGSTGNTYYITNNEGKYLTVSSNSLSFGISQTALTHQLIITVMFLFTVITTVLTILQIISAHKEVAARLRLIDFVYLNMQKMFPVQMHSEQKHKSVHQLIFITLPMIFFVKKEHLFVGHQWLLQLRSMNFPFPKMKKT